MFWPVNDRLKRFIGTISQFANPVRDSRLTVVLSYFNQATMLERHLQQWENYPQALQRSVQFIIIDDCSDIPAKAIVNRFRPSSLSLRVYRVLDNLYCNIAGVRNLGASECKTEWMLILDMDTMISTKLLRTAFSLIKKNRSAVAYRFNRTVPNDPTHVKNGLPHPAVCLIRKQDYWSIGGCEEDLVGNYGYTDPCFRLRADGKVKQIIKHRAYLEYQPEGESDITRDKQINRAKFYSYKANGGWSNQYLKFSWREEDL